MTEASRYGEVWAPIYDEIHAFLDPTAAVEALAGLARGGRALELGIGTGRVALPLAARGIEVHGIEISEPMVARLRGKAGGAAIPIVIGDFTEARADGEFALVYVVFSSLFGVLTQAGQVAAVRNATAHLAPDGVFVVEAFVPDPTRFDRQQRVQVNRIESARVDVLVSRHDPVAQHVTSQHVVVRLGGIELYPVEIRYAWPSELDLMAQLAGLRLRERWADWRGAPFTATSPMHVSIYERGGS
ncbi:MAG TPA: class I SAM-dependent methyltransferase [Kofleriaceae bacterium]|nr:class I SAM-dependent methyltransferase [Kofleriaceae bacterium]